MINKKSGVTVIPILCYPEIHFRFGGISPSLLFNKEPEILFDLPYRVTPGAEVHLYLLINHCNTYPIDNMELTIGFYQKGKHSNTTPGNPAQFLAEHPLGRKCQLYIIPLDLSDFSDGRITISPQLEYTIKKRKRKVLTDNLRTTSHTPLTIFKASEDLPGADITSYGDMHCHSLHSQSHVEFGPPVLLYRYAALSIGLSVVSVIDHSYDLECSPRNYLKRDSSLQNWHMQQEQKEENPVLLLTSEEHSSRKEQGGVVHLGILGGGEFIKGSGDGARRAYKRKSEPSLEETKKLVQNRGGLTFAAHPGEPATLMQRIFLRRDSWNISDMESGVNAIQAVNGSIDQAWYRARKMWISLLQKGIKMPLLAGNDAHGDFNRYRALAYPFIMIKEDMKRYFGNARTGFYTRPKTETELIRAIKEGQTFITTGPYLAIHRENTSIISNNPQSADSLTIIAQSSKEFGFLKEISLFVGSSSCEIVYKISCSDNKEVLQHPIEKDIVTDATYCRVECWTRCGENGYESFAATSPVYFF